MDYTVIKDIRYGDKVNNLLNLYIPSTIDKAKEQGLVVCIHGGGWNSLSKEGMDYECATFSKSGYLSAAIGYSFIQVDASQDPPTAVVSPEANVFIMLEDIEHAIKKIKVTVREMGFNVTRIALSGASSGSHLAMLFAYSRQLLSAIPVSFVCNAVGPTDLRLFRDFPLPDLNSYQLISALCGCEVNSSNIESKEIKQLIDAISPVTFINENSPPMVSAYGAKLKGAIGKYNSGRIGRLSYGIGTE